MIFHFDIGNLLQIIYKWELCYVKSNKIFEGWYYANKKLGRSHYNKWANDIDRQDSGPEFLVKPIPSGTFSMRALRNSPVFELILCVQAGQSSLWFNQTDCQIDYQWLIRSLMISKIPLFYWMWVPQNQHEIKNPSKWTLTQ